MEYEFHVQDPTAPDTVYLFEAIIRAIRGATSCAGIFAFASRAGVDSLLGDPEIRSFLNDSTMSLMIGLDAVTNRETLQRLRELEAEHADLKVRVFWNPTNALFHPKVALFEYEGGGRSLIVGSGNLTPGGLRQNFEAFSVLKFAADDPVDFSPWDRFLKKHAADIRPIDQHALDRAAQNTVRGRRRGIEPTTGTPPSTEHADLEPTRDVVVPAGGTNRFLVARVPKAGNRWQQVHFNVPVIEQFFRVRPNTTQRVYLVECRADGTFGDEEVRPCVYSDSNRNLKIEIASHRGEPYPETGPPIAVYRELHARAFAYMLLMPGDPGYDAMFQLTETGVTVGPGARRVMADRDDIRRAWPKSPLITAIDRAP